jgi:N-acetylneuraminic acid mutarotase
MFTFSAEIYSVAYQHIESGTHCSEELASSELETDFDFTSIVKVGNFLYATGGYDTAVCSSVHVHRYNPRFRNWTQLADMNEPRVSHAICASEDRIFVFGGINHTVGELGDEDNILSSVEVYDVRENNWQILTNLPTGSSNQAASFDDGCVYISGGISADPFDSVPMATVWMYNLDQMKWQPRRDMLYNRQGHSMTALDGKLYVFGGYTLGDVHPRHILKDCLNCEVFDIETNQWTEIRSIPDTFGHVMRSVGLWDRTFFLFGGGHLHSYHVDQDRMEYGNPFGSSVQKIAILDVAYPIYNIVKD